MRKFSPPRSVRPSLCPHLPTYLSRSAGDEKLCCCEVGEPADGHEPLLRDPHLLVVIEVAISYFKSDQVQTQQSHAQ